MVNRSSSARWYVFQSNNVFLAERQLNRQRFDTYVPWCMSSKTRHGIVIGSDKRELFRSYGFVRFSLMNNRWKRILANCFAVKRIISTSSDCPNALPIGAIESLQDATLDLLPEEDVIIVKDVAAHPPILPLDMDSEAQVISGPLKGETGIVQSSSEVKTVLLMTMLNSQVPVTFKRVNLRLLTKAD